MTYNVVEAVASTVRGAIIAPPGRKLVIADLANIEGRGVAWLAGEEWKLQAFRDLDAGTGPDLYAVAYARAFGTTPESVMEDDAAGGKQRQTGKVQELMLGYQGSVGAWVTGAATYRIELQELVRSALPRFDAGTLAKAHASWEWASAIRAASILENKKRDPTFNLPRDQYLACRGLVHLHRRSNPNTAALWPAMEAAAREAIWFPDRTVQCGRIAFNRHRNWLRMILPSGRMLCYAAPRVSDRPVEETDEEQAQDTGTITYMGINQYTRKWQRCATYGGKLTENATQGLARDVLTGAMRPAEDAGFEIVLHVYDELVAEVDEDRENCEELGHIMSVNQQWNEGLPLFAEAYTTKRYRKE